MKVVAFVPLKLNNERLPGKNTKILDDGRALVEYILATLEKVALIDEIYVYCSDESVAQYASGSRIKFLRRDAALDGNDTKINEVLLSFANDICADVYVLAHATAPFISSASIERAVQAVTSGGHDSALSVRQLQEFIWKDNKPFNYDLESVPRTQDLEPYYVETTGLYVYRRSLIVERNRRIGVNPYLVEVSKIEAIDINDSIDFELADAVVAKGLFVADLK